MTGFQIEFAKDGLWIDKNLRIFRENGRIKVAVFDPEKVDLRIMGVESLKCKNCGGYIYGDEGSDKRKG